MKVLLFYWLRNEPRLQITWNPYVGVGLILFIGWVPFSIKTFKREYDVCKRVFFFVYKKYGLWNKQIRTHTHIPRRNYCYSIRVKLLKRKQ